MSVVFMESIICGPKLLELKHPHQFGGRLWPENDTNLVSESVKARDRLIFASFSFYDYNITSARMSKAPMAIMSELDSSA